MHFEYISDAVSSGLMNVQLNSNLPVVYGILNCMNEDQVKSRSTGDNNHGYDWGKTAVEMALLRNEALNIKEPKASKLADVGFDKKDTDKEGEKKKPGFF